MLDLTVENAYIILKKYLEEVDPKRFEHSIHVAEISSILARKWNVNFEEAEIAGLLHDIGKSMNKKDMLTLCVRNNVTIYDFELWETAEALHGKVSSLLIAEEFNKNDLPKFERISRAISYHVAGGEEMSPLDKVIFIADNLEHGKNDSIRLKIQSGELNTLNSCVRAIIQDKIERANMKSKELNPMLNLALEEVDER